MEKAEKYILAGILQEKDPGKGEKLKRD